MHLVWDQGVVGSSPAYSTNQELWQTWCMRRTENPKNEVQLLEAPQHWKYGRVAEGDAPLRRYTRFRVSEVRIFLLPQWKIGRVVYCAGPENRLPAMARRFESCIFRILNRFLYLHRKTIKDMAHIYSAMSLSKRSFPCVGCAVSGSSISRFRHTAGC